MNREQLIEIVFLLVLFGGLLYIGPGSLFQHSLNHEKPDQYGATDGFLYAMLSEYVAETGNFKYYPQYSVEGFTDAIPHHPPILMHLAAMFAHTSGLSAYSSLSLIMGIFVLFGAFIMYLLIRSWNQKIAILAAPLFVFLYVSKFVVGYTWGEALLLMGTFFLIALFYIMSKPELKPWWVPAGILIAASINTHTSETIFFYGFAVFFLAAKFVLKQMTREELVKWLKMLALATILAVVLSFNYLPIFYNGYYKIAGGGYTSFKPMSPEEFGAIQVPPLQDFHWPVLMALLFGAAVAIILAKKNAHTAILASGFMFLVGLSNYIGLHYRAFQTRFLWPIYLALFFGLAIYVILKQVRITSVLITAVVGIALAAVFSNAYYSPIQTGAIYDGQWQGMKWLEQNTPDNSRVLFLFGDGYSQSARVLKRQAFQIEPSDYGRFIGALPNRSMRIEPVMIAEMKYLHRTGLFSFGYYALEKNMTDGFRPMDICSFDYYVVDKRSGYAPQLIQANLQVANTMIAHNMSGVYQNDHLAILKNNNVGGDCLG